MNVRAMIMAGGEGVRLRPMTVYRPKPLVPLLGEPVMGYSIRLLKQYGITDIGATLWYKPREIRVAFGRGEQYGVKMRYYEETVPLGTAGSVKMAKNHMTDTFFVLSGDGLTDCDLMEALKFHREKRALATLVLRRVHVPLPYGVVMTDGEGKITRFIEKPVWSKVFSNLVNTGIYILEPEIFEHIPDAGAPDFGKDIFPALVEAGLPVYGYEMGGYWCDVGDPKAYLSAQQALLRGETAFPAAGKIHEDAQVDPLARLEGECFIGKGAVIGPGCVIRSSVIGENCVVSAGAVIENSCLWERAAVGEKARLSGCILCDGAAVRHGADAASGCVLGKEAIAGAYARLLPGVKLWPHVRIPSQHTVSRSVTEGDCVQLQWTALGASCDSSETACRLCRSFLKTTGARSVMVAGSGNQAMTAVLSGALAADGARVLSAGEMTFPMLQTLVRTLLMDGGVYASGEEVRLIAGNGQPLTSKQVSAMDQQVMRCENRPAFAQPGSVIRFTGGEEVYLARVAPDRGGKALLSPVTVCCGSERMSKLALQGLRSMNVRNVRTASSGDFSLRPGETGFLLGDSGETLSLFTETLSLSREQMTMLLLSQFHRKNGMLYDLPGVPRAAEGIAQLQKADESESCEWQRTILRDGLAALFFLCGALKEGTVQDLMRGTPETYIQSLEIPCRPQDKGNILHALCGRAMHPYTLDDGVLFRHERGYATVVPDGYRSAVRVTGESSDAEFAKELCDFYQGQIKQLIQGKSP